jgi:hypothetical protein
MNPRLFSQPMKTKLLMSVSLLSGLALMSQGCSTNYRTSHRSGFTRVTIPNGSSPANANAPRGPMNDTEPMRSGWNHGNGVLWVSLAPEAIITLDPAAEEESSSEKKGYHRVKFGWWRGIRGSFIISGRRLDAPAPPLLYQIQPESYGDIGFIPGYLYSQRLAIGRSRGTQEIKI